MEKQPGDLEGLAEASGKAMEKESDPALVPKDPASADIPKPKDPVPTEDVPDPDEDDLDDLDGKLYTCLTKLVLMADRYA
jgi:peroxin-19